MRPTRHKGLYVIERQVRRRTAVGAPRKGPGEQSPPLGTTDSSPRCGSPSRALFRSGNHTGIPVRPPPCARQLCHTPRVLARPHPPPNATVLFVPLPPQAVCRVDFFVVCRAVFRIRFPLNIGIRGVSRPTVGTVSLAIGGIRPRVALPHTNNTFAPNHIPRRIVPALTRRAGAKRIAWQYAARVGDAGESRAESAGVSRFLPGGSSLVGR